MSEQNKKQCILCLRLLDPNRFYRSYNKNHPDGRVPVCTKCLLSRVRENNLQTVKDALRLIDKPFIYDIWDSAIGECKKNKKNVFGVYIKNIQMPQNRELIWDDSQFEPLDKSNLSKNEMNVSEKSNIEDENIKVNNQTITSNNNQNELIERWGYGYSSEEYVQFERKYNALKNHYPERTSMHTEALLTYIRYRVKEEMATASGDAKAAKDWGTLAKDAATAAKINPQQLSKSDLSDGLDSFSQLVRSVEQAVDIIEILPRFKERPKDKVDFTIWCYINYIRDLKGLPPAKYNEIYAFYEERKKEYEKMNEADTDG